MVYDRFSSLFWLLVALYACAGALQMGLGSLRKPGMGLMPFGISILLASLSLVVFFRRISRKDEGKGPPIFSNALQTRVLFVLVALVLYAKLMPLLGYLLATFILMAFLFLVIERKKVGWMVFLSFSTSLITYYVFSKWLNLQFPSGWFGL
jgi:putative tricarboxylic transport membrane protein